MPSVSVNVEERIESEPSTGQKDSVLLFQDTLMHLAQSGDDPVSGGGEGGVKTRTRNPRQ